MSSKYQDLQFIVGKLRCPECNGTGKMKHESMNAITFEPVLYTLTCYDCDGTGLNAYYRHLYHESDLVSISNV